MHAMNAEDFLIVPIIVGDECAVTIKHKWTQKEWSWKGSEEEWPEARDKLLATIQAELK